MEQKQKMRKRVLAVLLAMALLVTNCEMELLAAPTQAEVLGNVDVEEAHQQEAAGITEDTLSAVETEPTAEDGELPPSEKEEALILAEVEEERAEDQKTFRMNDGTFMVAQYATPVHYQDEDKHWQEVDYSLEETDIGTSEEGYETTEKTGKEERVKFSKKFKEGKTVSIKQTEYPLSWGFAGAEKSTVIIKTADTSEVEENKGHNERFLTMDTNNQTLTYPDIYEGIDAEYQVGLSGIKENLILKEAGTQTEFEILYDIGKLTAVQEDEQSIQLMNGDEVIYQIQAPYMKDTNGEYSDQLTLEITEQKNKKLRVQLSADEAWLNDEKRAYPVIIDPVVQTKTTDGVVDSTFIASGKSSQNFSKKLELLVGLESSEYETCRTLVKFTTLPPLNAGNVVVDAQLNLLNYKSDFYSTGTPNLQVNAHQIMEPWVESEVKWSNKPDYDTKVLDYDYIGATGTAQWRVFNVTEAVRSWYDKTAENYGILIKSYKEEDDYDYANLGVKAYFWPEDYNDEKYAYPTLQIVYRNNKGLEDYWDFTTLSAGTAGTVHINNYTGNLVLVHEDTATSGNLVPVNLQHIYNSYQLGNQQENPYPSNGKGWKLNMQQTLKSSSNYGLTGNAKTNYPYAHMDGDGTVHFFYKKTEDGTTKYYDEDGLDMRMTIQSSKDTKTINHKDGSKLVFNYYGNLRYIKDAKGNTATLAYEVYDDKDRVLKRIDDGAGHEIHLTHNADTYFLEKIIDVSGRETEYIYNDSEYLTKIKYPNDKSNTSDDKSSMYSYDKDGALKEAISADGSRLKFTYTDTAKGKQVEKVEEFDPDGNVGQTLTFDRSGYNTTVVRTSGKDDVFGNGDDLLTTYQFDNYGRTTGSYTKTADGVQYGGDILTYTAGEVNDSGSNIKQINRVADSAYAGKNVVNYLKNHSGEKEGDWIFTPEKTENPDNVDSPDATDITDYIGSISTGQKKFGHKSLQITGVANATSEEGRYGQTVTGLEIGKTYTLSGYVKTSGVTKGKDPESSYGAFLSLSYKDAQGNVQRTDSEYLKGTTKEDFEEGWRRISVTVSLPEGATEIQAGLHLKNAAGTAYFDALQLEEGKTYNAYNMFENAGFEVVTETGKAENWTTSGYESGDGPTIEEKFDGEKAIKVIGKGSKAKYIYQQIPITGTENDIYVMSAWAKAEALPDQDGDERHFNMYIRVYYDDGTDVLKTKRAEFNRDYNDWQKASAAFNLKDGKDKERTPIKISIGIHYSHQENLAFIDQVQVVRDLAESFTYDDDGNLTKSEENGNRITKMTYNSSGDMTSRTDAKGNKYTYTYNDQHKVTKEIKPMKQEVRYTYNDQGLLTAVKSRNSEGDRQIYTGTTYTPDTVYVEEEPGTDEENPDTEENVSSTEEAEGKNINAGAYVLKESDEDGKETSYDYNLMSGLLKSVTTSDGVQTSYSYDSTTDALTSVSQDSSKVYYHYNEEDTRLESIVHNGFRYYFEYDKFGNLISTKLGNLTDKELDELSDAEKAELEGVEDWNLTLSTNEYNEQNGKLESVTYGNGYKKEYIYDESGAVVAEKEAKEENKITGEWEYNDSGQLNEYRDLKNKRAYRYDYDMVGNLSELKVFDTSEGAESTASPTFTVNDRYNELNQLNKEQIEANGKKLSSTFAYNANGQPLTLTFDTEKELEYSYDSLGRLSGKELSLGTPLQYSYSYYLSQRAATSSVTYETNRLKEEILGDAKYVYSYDDRGNITAIQEKIKTIVAEEEVIRMEETHSYVYDDKNQLIRENDLSQDKTIVYNYDKGGNLLSRKEYAYTTAETIDETTLENTIEYTYSSQWKDQLAELNGSKIEYDAIGNPTSYLGKGLEWNGRELVKHTENDKITTYSYNADGLRSTKTVGNETTEYYYVGDLLSYEKRGDKEFFYTYDFSGNVVRIRYIHDGQDETYYPAVNSRGDVEALYNEDGTVAARYSYDTWGNILSTKDGSGQEIEEATHIGLVNPIRYRGYYYDSESGFYYVYSRYYDPEVGRFISADGQIAGVGGNISAYNLYGYCGNNPINRFDPDGHAWKDVKNWFSKTWNKVKTVVNNIKNTIKKSINKSAENHYSRNKKNKVNDSIDNIVKNYTKVSEWADKYHENTSGRQGSQAKYNDKYLSPNGGHYEVIICNAPNIEPYIVDELVDVSNMGTYNYAANDSFIPIYYAEHLVKDMIPYYLYGNTRDDTKGWLKWALD